MATRLPATVDRLIRKASDAVDESYYEFARCTLLAQPCEDQQANLMSSLARAGLVADLAGRKWFADRATRGGVDLHFDDVSDIDRMDLPEHYAKTPDPEILMAMPLKQMAKAFADFVPNIKSRILEAAERASSKAHVTFAHESARILDILKPSIDRTMTAKGIGIRSFFEDAEHALDRTQFRDVTRARLETIYRTNLGTAAHGAVYREAHTEEMIRVTPLYMYLAADDARVRPHHWAFNGFVAPADYALWNVIWPLNGYNCRCSSPISIFPRRAIRDGFMNKDRSFNWPAIKRTWRRARAAGLVTSDGQLTYPKEVQLVNRKGRKVTESMPAAGFSGVAA